MSDDLVEWLRARLAADQEKATDAQRAGLDDGWPFWVDTDDVGDYEAANAYRDHFKPARVLREVEALRKILARHEPIEVFGQLVCTYCGVTKGASRPDASWPCPDLRDLAEIFSDRPGYQGAWRS